MNLSDEKVSDNDLRISGENARIVITNCYYYLRTKFKGYPLWSMVGNITGHGSGYSYEICKSANLDPNQLCGKVKLQDMETKT
jgi:hypothetical protein